MCCVPSSRVCLYVHRTFTGGGEVESFQKSGRWHLTILSVDLYFIFVPLLLSSSPPPLDGKFIVSKYYAAAAD